MILREINGYLYNPYEIEFHNLRLTRLRKLGDKKRFNFPLKPYFITWDTWDETVTESVSSIDNNGLVNEKPFILTLRVKHDFICAN